MATDMRFHLRGLLLGGAVGDALGLPAEGLSADRLHRWWPGELHHRFALGRGMISDDTEHAFMTAQAWLAARGDVDVFRRSLSWQLRWWLAALPAGVGFATARACLRLWLGVPPDRSGVDSAGNGPSMRSAILGAVFAQDPVLRRDFVRASTRITHRDPRAETAARAVADAVAWSIVQGERARTEARSPDPALPAEWFDSADSEWRERTRLLEAALSSGDSVGAFAGALGVAHGVTGYAYHTVPVSLFAWLRHRGDFATTLTAAIQCGGDTDTVAAIAGALAGCDVGIDGIPAPWRQGLVDWPRSPRVLLRLADELATPCGRPVPWCWPGVLPRNLVFLALVLGHGFRRCLPPY